MGEREIFNQINDILEKDGYKNKINDLTDLMDYLNSKNNTESKVYDDVRELYDLFIMGPGMW
ncbi:UNVERIFIED_CONTAM: hypothetical protein Cloal_2262 [Acetivibrio alkalicellulosi]